MIQEYQIEAECPDSTCWYDIKIEVVWSIVDLSFDHEFGTRYEYGYEVEETTINEFTAYDEDGEIVDQFDIKNTKDPKNYKKDRTYKRHIKRVQQMVDDYLNNAEVPEIDDIHGE